MKFQDWVDVEGLEPAERARLERMHELLLEAGPPADLPTGLDRFRCSTSAPNTLQYHSIIASRRLVCNTRCDSFFGDGMAILPRALTGLIGAPEPASSQQRCRRPNRRGGGASAGRT